MSRPGWDEYFIRIAVDVGERSTCLRRGVGAILVRDKRILTTGYNGPPRGLAHCEETGCLRQERGVRSGERHELCRGIHAEMNALLQGAMHGVSIEGATLYCTSHPCALCAKMLINCGVQRIVTLGDYPDDLAKEMLKSAGVMVNLIEAGKREKDGEAEEQGK